MGTTPTYSWPYPEPTDPVANGAQDIEDLALAVETTVSGLPAGKILQVVQTEHTTVFSTTSTSFVDVTGLAVTITPTSATSKVLLIANGAGEINANRLAFFTLYRGGASTGTNLGNGVNGFGSNYSQYGLRSFFSIAYLDSPATTSATTYNVAIRSDNASGSASVMNGSMRNTILALEVSA